MEKLITMTEYVIQLPLGEYHQTYYHKMAYQYAQLLQTPLELGQFIPCKDREPLEDMFCYDRNPYCAERCRDCVAKGKAYRQAQSQVLFEGWEYVTKFGGNYLGSSNAGFQYGDEKYKTIEDLINSGIELRLTKPL